VAKSTTSSRRGKPAKPGKPYADFPLFAHDSGRWARKFKGSFRYYGYWARREGGQLVRVPDVDASASAAKLEHDRCWPWHSLGLDAPDPAVTPEAAADDTRWTMADLCNKFLEEKHSLAEGGERSMHTVAEYIRTTDRLIEKFKPETIVDDLTPIDFAALRRDFAKDCNAVTLRSKIRRARVVFSWGAKNGRAGEMRPANFGTGFDIPAQATLTRVRNEAGERMFEAAELRLILNYLDGQEVIVASETVKGARDVVMRAAVLLACNCAFGPTDLSLLPQSALNLDTGWVKYARQKTQVMRRIPLWAETVQALRLAIVQRPAPADPVDEDLVFLTARGTRYVRVQESKKKLGRFVTINAIARRFDLILAALKLNGQKGRGLYTARHVFETIAGESQDQVAVNAVMGHSDGTQAGNYRQRISDERLLKVVDTVKTWLFS